MTSQMPSWAAPALAICVLVWSAAVAWVAEGSILRAVVRVAGTRRDVLRTVAAHLVLLLACLTFTVAAGAVRVWTAPASWAAGLVVLVGAGTLGPLLLLLTPRTLALEPPHEELVAAGATPDQARLVRGLGAPFAVVELALVVVGTLAALAL